MDGHAGWVTCLAFVPDGQLLASGGRDNNVLLWDLNTGKPIKVLEGHQERISNLAVTSDGQTLVSASWDATLRVWQSELGRLWRFPVGHTTLDDLHWTQAALRDPDLAAAEHDWLAFLRALMQWRRRHDIQLEESARIVVGEYDIEIAG